MKRFIAVGLVLVAAVAAPWTASASSDPAGGEVDITGVDKTGSNELTVWGTIKCNTASPVQLDAIVNQESTGGTGAGGDNSHICLEAGDTIKWVLTVTGPGPWLIGDKVTVTAIAAFLPDSTDPPIATKTEDHVLGWGR